MNNNYNLLNIASDLPELSIHYNFFPFFELILLKYLKILCNLKVKGRKDWNKSVYVGSMAYQGII